MLSDASKPLRYLRMVIMLPFILYSGQITSVCFFKIKYVFKAQNSVYHIPLEYCILLLCLKMWRPE